MKLMKLSDATGSSPVYDPEIIKAAEQCVSRPTDGEVSLQKLDVGVDVYMWHYRAGVYWHGDGNYMVIPREQTEQERGVQ